MLETDTLLANNHLEPTDWSGDPESYLLFKHFVPKLHPYPYQAFQVIVNTGWIKQSDLPLLFDEDRGMLLVPMETTAADLMARLNLFPSKSQARKNGWPGPIPDGWSELRSGKFVVFVWKPLPDSPEWNE